MKQTIWQPPRLQQELPHEEERKVGWLELFYDLVYVAAIIQLGNLLSDNVSAIGFLEFAALFVPLWWAWTGITFYVNRFVVDDLLHRLLIFAQMFFIVSLAISVANAFGGLATQFAAAYTAVRVLLVVLYIRAWRHAPSARPLTIRYIRGFSIAAAIWFISIFVPPPWQYALWAAAMLADLSVPFSPKSRRLQSLLPPDVEHMAERYGLFTIIVLGEGFVKVMDGLSGSVLSADVLFFSIFGLAAACSLWWLYFDDIAGAEIRPLAERPFGAYVWIYSHLPLAVGITSFGVAVKKLITQPMGDPLADKYRWLMAAAIIIYLIAVALLDRVTIRSDSSLQNDSRAWIRGVAAVLVLLLALLGGSLTPTGFMAATTAVLAAQIGIDLWGSRQPDKSTR